MDTPLADLKARAIARIDEQSDHLAELALDIHATPDGPRYATRKDFVYGEDVTIGDWTISTDNLPRYGEDRGTGQPKP